MSDAVVPQAVAAPINVSPGGEGAPAVSAAAPQSNDWTTGFNDDAKGYVQNKGFKDPASMVDSYRNLEKLMGGPKEKLLRLPDKDDAPEWGEVYKKLGTPDKPEDYKFKLSDQVDAKWAQGAFHEAKLTAKQAETLANKWTEHIGGAVKAQQEQLTQKIEEETQGLKKEWGLAYEQNIDQAKRAALGLGVKPEALDALEKTIGYTEVLKFMHSLGAKLGESSFVTPGQQGGFGGAMSPEAARNQINALKTDSAFVQKFTSGDSSARQEMERLHKFAYPAQN